MRANFPTGRSLPTEDENVQSVKRPILAVLYTRPQGHFAKTVLYVDVRLASKQEGIELIT